MQTVTGDKRIPDQGKMGAVKCSVTINEKKAFSFRFRFGHDWKITPVLILSQIKVEVNDRFGNN